MTTETVSLTSGIYFILGLFGLNDCASINTLWAMKSYLLPAASNSVLNVADVLPTHAKQLLFNHPSHHNVDSIHVGHVTSDTRSCHSSVCNSLTWWMIIKYIRNKSRQKLVCCKINRSHCMVTSCQCLGSSSSEAGTYLTISSLRLSLFTLMECVGGSWSKTGRAGNSQL